MQHGIFNRYNFATKINCYEHLLLSNISRHTCFFNSYAPLIPYTLYNLSQIRILRICLQTAWDITERLMI
ncbi:hypothetical protein T4B_6021 [Trichinella pseudospiralis]|uniref:Uncharacterized protein n=1 Tax=Trichinella pseudospiralis TaxID=6337 RepID=A0A0V1J2I1_TRIPS|nr:hypothetical protein T4B_6021 [Trichinella pseudospiralis]